MFFDLTSPAPSPGVGSRIIVNPYLYGGSDPFGNNGPWS